MTKKYHSRAPPSRWATVRIAGLLAAPLVTEEPPRPGYVASLLSPPETTVMIIRLACTVLAVVAVAAP